VIAGDSPPVSDACVHELFEARAARSGSALAMADAHEQVTYDELNRRANALARRLRQRGVEREVVVAVILERSVAQATAMLAVLKAGGACLPLDPAYPPLQLDRMLADAAAAIVVSRPELISDLRAAPPLVLPAPPDEAAEDLGLPGDPRSLACIFYTSGSTGEPKGVELEHTGIVNEAAWTQRTLGLGPGDRSTWLSSPAFAISRWELWTYLLAGASVHICEDSVAHAPERLRDWVVERGITVSFVITWAAERLFGMPWPEGTRLRTLITGGEAVRVWPPATLPFEVVVSYGITEVSSVRIVSWPNRDGRTGSGPPPIGRPIDNTRAYLLDARRAPVAEGAVGELYIGGLGLARGYRGRPELTAERFLPDPFADAPGARMYRTGDLARVLPEGELAFAGRADDQAKLRGARIEPGAIESVLAEHEAIEEAAAAVVPGPAGDRLVAFVVHRSGREEPLDGVRGWLADRLPVHLVPTALVPVEALPRSPNGKLDRRALQALELPPAPRSSKPPRTRAELLVAEAWREAGGIEDAAVDDDFFAIGGESLGAMRLLAYLHDECGLELTLREFLRSPTIGALARMLPSEPPSGPSRAHTRARERDVVAGTAFPLSPGQERLWALDRLEPGSPRYNEHVAMWLRGRLDEGALGAALGALVERHAALRTRIVASSDGPVALIDPPAAPPLERLDLRAEADPRAAALARAEAFVRRPFDLEHGPLFRVLSARHDGDGVLLTLALHHTVTDGLSARNLVTDLAELYGAAAQGRSASLAPLDLTYLDFARERRRRLGDGSYDADLDFWARALHGAPPELALPADRPRPPRQGASGARVHGTIDANLAARLERLARDSGATVFMSLLAGYVALLARYTAARDVVVGTLLPGRPDAELDPLVGFFVNTVAVRVGVEHDEAFGSLLGRVRDACLDAYAHGDVPFAHVVERLRPARDPRHAPLVQVLFDLEPEPVTTAAGGVAFEPAELEPRTSKLDLSLAVRRHAGGYATTLEYDTDLFERERVERMLGALTTLYAAACDSPGRPIAELPLVEPGEARALVADSAGQTAARTHARRVHELFEAQAAARPHAIAAVDPSERVTYAELNGRANALARRLRSRGIAREQVVAVLLERSVAQAAALLAVLKAGGACLPLDPAYPAARLRRMLADSGAMLLVSRPELAAEVQPAVALEPPHVEAPTHEPDLGVAIDPRDAAYVMYTSGSSGEPKAVVVEHASIENFVLAEQELLAPGPDARVLALSSPSFDASLSELFLALAGGGQLHAAQDAAGGRPLAAALRSAAIDTLVVAPSVLATIEPDDAPGVRTVVLGGEPCPAALVRAWAPGRRVFNSYGPTEATLEATLGRCTPSAAAPALGRPLPGVRVYVLDSGGNPVPAGVPGEIHIGGVGVARGYLNRPEENARRFPPDPFAGAPDARMYRTGDLARERPNGELEFVGRVDDQLQVRGCRVEPGEVEAVLAEHPAVRQAAVVGVAAPDDHGVDLAAFFVPLRAVADTGELQRHARGRLPGFMVPSRWLRLDELPRTPNGKVDREALRRLAAEARPVAASDGGRQTPVEDMLARLWERVLDVEHVTAESDFFDLGGHSLTAVELAGEIEQAFDGSFPPGLMFELPVLSDCAERVAQGRGGPAPPPLRRREPQPRRAPSAQERELWELDRAFRGRPLYTLPFAYRVVGPIDRSALRESVAQLARRHDVLRSAFVADGGAPYVEAERTEGFEWREEDVQGPDAIERAGRAMIAAAARPFDLERGPFLRVLLIRLGDSHHLLVMTLHHIVVDGWSVGILWDELSSLYAARAAGSSLEPASPGQYADYAAWQRELRQSSVGASQLAYWREQLAGAADPATSDWAPDGRRGFAAARLPFALDADLSAAVDAAARVAGTSLHAVLIAALAGVLRDHSDDSYARVLTLLPGRRSPLARSIVGLLASTVLVRVETGDDPSHAELVRRAHSGLLDAHAHQDVPFEDVLRAVADERGAERAGLAPVLLNFEGRAGAALRLAGAEVSELDVFDAGAHRVPPTTFQLIWTLREDATGVRGTLDYHRGIFDRDAAETVAEELTAALRLCASPARA
jgi:amino acid adenylation domain-containing protein